ncbi:MAG: hypothetical protein V7L13_23905 [Nostoc sp.]|uniref:hypothetical protein n=1 Tax=Nostoc sp. TaxID=1180 RepID=UPI002FF8D899
MYLGSEELVISVGEMIQYELANGEVADGEVIEVSEELNMVQVLPTSNLIKIPEWVKAEDILLDDDIEFVME